jgi:excisionase family DNA binding protein
MTPLLLTQIETATLLKVSRWTVDRWAKSRLLPFVQYPGGKRFRLEDVESFLSSRSFGHPANLPSPQAHHE